MADLVATENSVSPQAWDAFVRAHRWGHVLQSWNWGELKGAFGWRPLRIAVERRGEIVAGAQMLLRPTPIGSLAYIPKGPVVDMQNTAVIEELLGGIRRAARRHRAIHTTFEPEWWDVPEARAWFATWGLAPSEQTIQPRRTIIVDIATDEETILQRMKSKTRYNIRLAARKGVTVCAGGLDDVDTFHRIMTVTGERDEFGVHSLEYYRKAWVLFAPQGVARLFLAYHGDTPLAGLMAFALGSRAWYMYGASSNEYRNLMPTYLLQWEAIRWAKELGCETYDLYGIPDLSEERLEEALSNPETLGEDPPALWGVYRNKRGYGGAHTRYVGAFDLVHRPLAHRLLKLALRTRSSFRG